MVVRGWGLPEYLTRVSAVSCLPGNRKDLLVTEHTTSSRARRIQKLVSVIPTSCGVTNTQTVRKITPLCDTLFSLQMSQGGNLYDLVSALNAG